jgi:BirA family biotin operon repressor/biotin-[acetyl-CoA-carboxylase] ligase
VQLGAIARARGARLLALDAVDSTNDEARGLIEGGERGPLWIVAARQSAGRGRLGRDWASPEGNFHGSFVIGDFADARVAPELGFVAGLAAREAALAIAPSARVTLKWPNDLLLDGAKLGGILLECVTRGDAPVAIVGVGVNIARAPDGLPYPARALSEVAPGADREIFLAHFSDAMAQTLASWRGGDGFADIRARWLAGAAGVGGDIRVELGDESVCGRFETIDNAGRLVMETAAGRRVIFAGDVVIGPRAAEGARG